MDKMKKRKLKLILGEAANGALRKEIKSFADEPSGIFICDNEDKELERAWEKTLKNMKSTRSVL